MNCNEKDCIIKSILDSVYKLDGHIDNVFDELDASYQFLDWNYKEIQREISKLYNLINLLKKENHE